VGYAVRLKNRNNYLEPEITQSSFSFNVDNILTVIYKIVKKLRNDISRGYATFYNCPHYPANLKGTAIS